MDDGTVAEGIRRLASGNVVPCKDANPFTLEEANARLKDLPGWVLQSGSIKKEFRFNSYLAGLDFAYAVGKIAELENHHPELFIGWRRVTVQWSTHTIKGLSPNDFIMAAKSETEYNPRGRGLANP